MRFVQILLVPLVLSVSVALPAERKDNEITCHCGVFDKLGEAQMKGDPLLHNSLKITAECDFKGAKDCGELCKDLGKESAAENSPELCHLIKNTNKPLHPTMYSKICDSKVWTYTGLTANDYCCVEGKHDICLGTFDYD